MEKNNIETPETLDSPKDDTTKVLISDSLENKETTNTTKEYVDIVEKPPKSVFLIPSRVQNTHQAFLLKTCIESIKEFNPESDIVILNDCSTESLVPTFENVKIEYIEKEYHGCGELNAYVWACKNYTEYDTFVMIHDSTKLLSKMPLTMHSGRIYRPIWHSTCCIDTDTRGEEMNRILEKFSLNVLEGYNLIQRGGFHGNGGGNMVFGAMGIFTNQFAKRLATETNFIELAKLFNKRTLRCFFERFVFCIIHKYQDTSNFRAESLCGCIFNHGNPFKNITPEAHAAKNPYIVKCWQSR
jgi:hypothetical protein